ncbi:MAG: ABC transporter substrate-binding protein [Deltaproteobacteria bacterium]|jgi:branched-chain amino acid transport system substrate-binding protein|nr:ABC transporter substrate-binding protein [Deltaproteobacteria bacterium]
MKSKFGKVMMVFFAVLVLSGGIVWGADPIYIGVSAPLTGNYAEYGQNWKKAMDLGLGWINSAGGVKGRPIELIYTDSKSDPKESAAVAQKYVSDKRIVATMGDFTSTACMAAQPIYDRGGLVQLSPTASHPKFAPGSVWSFGIIGTQAGEGPFMANYAVKILGKKKIAVLYINNDWGIATKDYFVNAAKEMGAEILAIEAFFEADKDFTGVLTKLRGVKPELLYIPSMYNEMALIAKQREKLGWIDILIMGPGSLYSPKLLEIGGASVNGLYTSAVFFPKDPRPEVQKFVKGFEEKYKSAPNMFAAIAYDGINLMAEVLRKAGTDRKAIRDELEKTKNFPGVTGKITFTERRDVIKDYRHLVIKNVEFTLYEGK